MLIKKYGNRRLYDTDESRYITLEELGEKVRRGADVTVEDAKSGEDLTQSTLTQLIVESRGAAKLLPIPLLHQLIRLGDDALADFFGRYVTYALEMYLQMRGRVSFNPFASFMPFGGPFSAPPAPGPGPAPAQTTAPAAEVDELRRELDALKRSLRRRRK
jgi:polyhydroxyalkanoate synthesis repressor PhaR